VIFGIVCFLSFINISVDSIRFFRNYTVYSRSGIFFTCKLLVCPLHCGIGYLTIVFLKEEGSFSVFK